MTALPAALDHLRHPKLRRLAAYWLERRGSRELPRRADIDPVDVPWALLDIALYDHVAEVGRFRCRVAGQRVTEMIGVPMQGRFLDEILPERLYAVVGQRYARMIQERAIVHSHGAVYGAHGKSSQGERLVLPLGDDDGRAAGYVTMTTYDPHQKAEVERLIGPRPYEDVTFTPVTALAAPTR